MSVRHFAIPLLCLTLLLGACSRLDFGYRNLDWLIPWSLSDYIKLSREQKKWLKPRLQETLSWHCSTQLPAYSAWLQRSQELAGQPQVRPAEFEGQFDEFRHAIDAIATQITPDTIELLQSLSDKQVADLQSKLDAQQSTLRKESQEQPLEKQVAERVKRMEERLRPWFGRLSAEQKQRIEQWSADLGEQNQAWLDNRAHWQALLMDTLRQRHDEQFAARFSHLLQQRHDLWTPAYRQQFEHSQTALAELFADLFNSADAAQRERLQSRLADLRKNLEGLTCPTTT